MKAIHVNVGEVEVLAGPEQTYTTSKQGHDVYWVRFGDGELASCPAEYITFPPHDQYWRNEYGGGASGMPRSSLEKAIEKIDSRDGYTHTVHHFQQDKDGPWQSETVHWKERHAKKLADAESYRNDLPETGDE